MSTEPGAGQRLDATKRKEFIFAFFQSAGIVELIIGEQLAEIWEITDELDDAINCKAGSGRNYLSMALSCLSHRGGRDEIDKWQKFATSLAAVFLRENKSIFTFLDDIVQTIKMASEHDPFQQLSAAHVVIATEFALDILRLKNLEQSICHYESQTRLSGRLN